MCLEPGRCHLFAPPKGQQGTASHLCLVHVPRWARRIRTGPRLVASEGKWRGRDSLLHRGSFPRTGSCHGPGRRRRSMATRALSRGFRTERPVSSPGSVEHTGAVGVLAWRAGGGGGHWSPAPPVTGAVVRPRLTLGVVGVRSGGRTSRELRDLSVSRCYYLPLSPPFL